MRLNENAQMSIDVYCLVFRMNMGCKPLGGIQENIINLLIYYNEPSPIWHYKPIDVLI